MEQIFGLMDDISEVEEAIASRIKEETFSEIILPSTPLEEVIDTIKCKDSDGEKKFIETEIDGEHCSAH